MEGIFKSTKIIDGFSTCFRQWRSYPIHCSFLHGYSISFKVTFQGELDYRNWIVDFGFLKRGKTPAMWNNEDGMETYGSIGQWFTYMFDHSTIVSKDDPFLQEFQNLSYKGALQLRIEDQVGCEMFAKMVYDKLNQYLIQEVGDRVKVASVECFEHPKNSAIYEGGIAD